MHTARVQPGMTLAVYVDPQNPVDMAIDWIRTGQLGPPPPGSTPGAGEPGRARSSAPMGSAGYCVSAPVHRVGP